LHADRADLSPAHQSGTLHAGEAFAVHGFSEFLADKPLFAQVVDEFLDSSPTRRW
jgi:hypothetical protein